jgi:hypothetical protein
MKNIHLSHPFDLDAGGEELDLFAEEVHDSQQHDLPPNSLSTLGCDCGLSTFFCYGCGLSKVQEGAVSTAGNIGDLENLDSAFNYLQEKLNAPAENDKEAEVLQTLFRAKKS